jgi:hypothetical protein
MPKRKILFPSQGKNFTREELMGTPMLEGPMGARFACDSFLCHDIYVGGLDSLIILDVYHYLISLPPQCGPPSLILFVATIIQLTTLLNDPMPLWPPLHISQTSHSQPQSHIGNSNNVLSSGIKLPCVLVHNHGVTGNMFI